ncbi:ferric reductase like transmembrane component-domain-containing protein [Hypoxylon sp. FL1150]|nr:ferric reductase like transmembrane component-domain-containing protein [Hypoxylon sp. FL1150]
MSIVVLCKFHGTTNKNLLNWPHAVGGQGLIGYGQWWYDPKCCYACRSVIESAQLDCPDGSMGEMDMDMTMDSPMAPCIAENFAFLSTLAYCINSNCLADGVPAWRIEKYWADQATGDPLVPAKWTYGATLANVTQAPDRIWENGKVLNYTARVSPSDYDYHVSFDSLFDWEEKVQSTYVITIIAAGVGTPLLMTILDYLPYIGGILDKLKPYLVYPSTTGTYSARPLPWLLRNAPTIGQSLYITMFVALNVVLGAVSYQGFGRPHPWGFTPAGEIMSYVGYRTGHIAFALLPLTVLFASRNNFLLWVTNWSFSTFLVLHRWVARVCALQAVVHSITLLGAYISTGGYYTDVHEAYWIWGIVATLCLVVLLFHSVIWFRRASYELFLVLHILLTVFTITGCWYHVMYWHGFTGIYEYWVYAVCAVWFFDRLLRVSRICRNGIRRATGVRWVPLPGYHAYAYFPTLVPLRPWENHPFSIVNTGMLRSRNRVPPSTSFPQQRHSSDVNDVEEGKGKQEVTVAHQVGGTRGISLYVKNHSGMTKYLRARRNLPVLFDGPYRGNASGRVLRCDRVLLIGGGIGVTGLLPWITAHVNVKLAWSLKQTSEPLAKDLATALENIVDKEVLIGKRLSIKALLAQEVQAGWDRIGVVVCGPDSLCDDVRAAVVVFGRREKAVFELEVDAFSW